MPLHPLMGRARPVAAVVASAAVLASGLGMAAVPSADAATRRVAFSDYVTTSEADALGCRLSGGPGSRGLKLWPRTVRTRIAAQFGLWNIGGYRPGNGRSDHHSGRALDIMVRGDRGTEVADWVRANAETLNVKYVIWQQGYWQPGMTSYRPMEDRGSETANHWDHVHVSFKRGSGTCPAPA